MNLSVLKENLMLRSIGDIKNNQKTGSVKTESQFGSWAVRSYYSGNTNIIKWKTKHALKREACLCLEFRNSEIQKFNGLINARA